MWKTLKKFISSFHVTTFGFEQVCVEGHCMPPHLSSLLKLFLPPRARRQPLLCANSLHLSHSSSPHLSCYIISHPPRGPGGCNSSPRDTGFRGHGPSRPGCSGLSGSVTPQSN
ncbi:hypothetical protein NHX12_016252, partial [Muraenolepis orangiensis]